MGFIAFPFIVCLILAPFIWLGMGTGLFISKKRQKKAEELFDRRLAAQKWLYEELNKHDNVSHEEYERLREEGKQKFNIEHYLY